MTDSVALLHYTKSRLTDRWFLNEGYWTVPCHLGMFSQSTSKAQSFVERLLDGMTARSTDEDLVGEKMDNIISRIELIWRENGLEMDDQRRGMVLYSASGRAQMHVVHALMGYGGSGPALTEAILRQLGVPREMFEVINTTVRSHDYHIVISREPTMKVQGVEVTVPRVEPESSWRWWAITP